MSSTNHASDAHIVATGLACALPDGRALFHDLTVSVGRECTGLIGPNGSGKTTLLRLLSGELIPTAGSVHRAGVVATLAQDIRPSPGARVSALLGLDERLAALARLESGRGAVEDLECVGDAWDLRDRTTAVLARVGLEHVSLDRAAESLSGGELTRAALAGLILGRPDILLFDEPTNNLDAPSREALYELITAWTGGVVCVSHDRELLRRMDRIVELSSVGVRVYGGNYDDFVAQRAAERMAAERELDSARAALRDAEQKAREVRERQARREARGRRQRANANIPKILLNTRAANAEATSARIDAVSAREVDERRARVATARERVEEREQPRLHVASTRLPAGRTVLEIEEVVVRFGDAATPVLDGVSLRIRGPERVALAGPNGSGKTSLLRVAMGELTPSAGTVRRLAAQEIAFLDQNGARLDAARSVLENFRLLHPLMDETATRYALARFLFADDAAMQPLATLSGGERLRASLACVLGGERPPSFLVLDEPTNHLDLDSIAAMESALGEYDGALLVVSHDEAFLEAIGIERRMALRRRR
ncbi:MAG TPA: ABC-F family ATP-binding cassette domain-containing protein [Gemmatimonadaceae bacterium]|nr:ABC-F family ATP-binding cassette domain-containing protein [Gemmatimonadaceae bacterium]